MTQLKAVAEIVVVMLATSLHLTLLLFGGGASSGSGFMVVTGFSPLRTRLPGKIKWMPSSVLVWR